MSDKYNLEKKGSLFGSKSKVPAGHVEVTIDQINHFNGNPRKKDNPKFEEIKSSIKQIGLETPLTLTKRANEDFYIPYNGGNTRLLALKELYAETKDERFNRFIFKVVPYTSEADLLIRHLAENETRADMMLIDKSIAVNDVAKLYEKEFGTTPSRSKLKKYLEQSGLYYSDSLISTFLFTAKHLKEHLPIALSCGLGRPSINYIRKIFTAFATFLKEKHPDADADVAQQVFLDILSAYDHEEGIDIDAAMNKTCDELAKKLPNGNETDIRFEMLSLVKEGKLAPDPAEPPINPGPLNMTNKEFKEKKYNNEIDVTTHSDETEDTFNNSVNTETQIQKQPLDGSVQTEVNSPNDELLLVESQIKQQFMLLHKISPKIFGDHVPVDDRYPFFVIDENVLTSFKALVITQAETLSLFDKTVLTLCFDLMTAHVWTYKHIYQKAKGEQPEDQKRREKIWTDINNELAQTRADGLAVKLGTLSIDANYDELHKRVASVKQDITKLEKLYLQYAKLHREVHGVGGRGG